MLTSKGLIAYIKDFNLKVGTVEVGLGDFLDLVNRANRPEQELSATKHGTAIQLIKRIDELKEELVAVREQNTQVKLTKGELSARLVDAKAKIELLQSNQTKMYELGELVRSTLQPYAKPWEPSTDNFRRFYQEALVTAKELKEIKRKSPTTVPLDAKREIYTELERFRGKILTILSPEAYRGTDPGEQNGK